MQLPTGAGKTHIFAEMAKASRKHGNNVWIIVPRNELLEQASDKLSLINVPHGRIAPGYNESKAFNVHVISKDTLIKRVDKIKRNPDFIIIDEAHIALDRYLFFAECFPNAKILGVTATPERLDGRGLSEIYETLVLGPSIQELISYGYLCDIEYYAPPIEGLEKVHRRGTEYKPDELSEFLAARKIYGKAFDHYTKLADGRKCLIFCRSIKDADRTADKFSSDGRIFLPLNGHLSKKTRAARILALRNGEIDGLTSCELATYGLDVPSLECIVMLRPTLSRALYMQMIGRGLRPMAGKKNCIILDHVGNLQQHSEPWLQHEWNFEGREKTKRSKNESIILRLCPELGYRYCDKPSCVGCEHNSTGRRSLKEEIIEGQLEQVKGPVKFTDLEEEKKQKYVDRINESVHNYQACGDDRSLIDLLQVAKELNRGPLWVYNRLTTGHTVNVSLLHAIAKIKKYKPGWVWFQRQRLKKHH
jgi:superfamily II DNA or RNA helicase